MALLRRRHKADDVPRAGPYAPGWDVPARFNFTRDVVEVLAKDQVRSALTFVDHEGIVDRQTFAGLSQDAARWAHLLRTRLDRGDRVLFAIGSVPAWLGAMLGALKSGLVAVPCANDLRARDLAFRTRHSGARLVVADRALEAEVEEMRHQVPGSVSVLFLDEALDEARRYLPVAPTEDTTAGETALLLYTSGTSAEPKAAVHTHAYTWAARAQATHWLGAQEGDVVWCTAGTGSAKAIWNVLLGPWSVGAEVVLHERAFDPEERLALLQRLGVTVLCQSPTEYRMLGRLEKLPSAFLPRLRHGVSSGEPLSPELIARFQDALGLTIYDGYGQTENSLLVANTPGSPLRPGSMGTPTPGHDITVIDEAGHVCAPGVEGDLALMGVPPTLFTGYWDAPDETAAAFRGSWYLTGDRAYRDEDGYLWYVGRADDVILSSAYRIGPVEVESALLEHPAVAESAVVGVPDPDRGQIVKAFVVLRPGHEPGERLAAELQEHVKAVTAPYKYPRAVSFVEELPRTASGKVRRRELRRLNDEIPEIVPGEAGEAVGAAEAGSERPEPLRLVVPDADEQAVREAEEERRARAAAAEGARRTAEALERTRREAEARARTEAEAAERARVETEARARVDAERARLAAEERARVEAEAQAQARVEAEDAARVEAEERARIEAEAIAEQARIEAEEAARREAEEHARAEAAAAEQARIEAEEAARREAEEHARIEAEAIAEQARIEAEEAARREAEEHARAEAAAAEQARIEAEEAARREAEEHARAEAEEAERLAAEARARLEAEALVELPGSDETLDAEDEEEPEPAKGESWAEARRRRREEKAAAKQRAEDDRRRAKEEEEQRKRDEIAAREDAKRREAEEKEAAKRRAEEEKLAARRRAEEERQREEEERRRQREEAKAKKRGLGKLFRGEEPADEYEDDGPAEPIPGIVERLRYYSGVPGPAPADDEEQPPPVAEEHPPASRTADPE